MEFEYFYGNIFGNDFNEFNFNREAAPELMKIAFHFGQKKKVINLSSYDLVACNMWNFDQSNIN